MPLLDDGEVPRISAMASRGLLAPGGQPLLVVLAWRGADQAFDGVLVGENTDHIGAPSDLLVQALRGFRGEFA